MANKTFLFGIIGGIAVAVALASLFSMGAVTAQMTSMPSHDQYHQQTMQQGQHQGVKHSMFSASGMSMVQDVRIAGVSITGDNEVTANMIYTGNTTSPGVTVVAMTNHKGMMDMMGGASMGGMSGTMGSSMMGSSHSMGSMGTMAGHSMIGGSMPGWHHPDMPAWNATQWNQWHSQMTAQMGGAFGQSAQMQPQSGTTMVESGWQSGGTTVNIILDGDASAYGASDIYVMVFPHLTQSG
jgi:hypothetical protein